MFGKTLILVAGATGYILGARAGRERYDQIKEQADRLLNNPKVQKAASDVQDVVAEKAPLVKDQVSSKVNTPDASGSTGANAPTNAGSKQASAGSTATHKKSQADV